MIRIKPKGKFIALGVLFVLKQKEPKNSRLSPVGLKPAFISPRWLNSPYLPKVSTFSRWLKQ
jgi:hypothetical protein